jgi:hypothetical protein
MNFLKNIILINIFVLLVSLFNGCSTKNDTINTPREQSSYIQDKNLTMAGDICKQNDIDNKDNGVCPSKQARNTKRASSVSEDVEFILFAIHFTVDIAIPLTRLIGSFF